MNFRPKLDETSSTPLYRQLYEQISSAIRSGYLLDGERIPATREMANQIGLNRSTVASAYALLEQEGLLYGHVGRGSFVKTPAAEATAADTPGSDEMISFASSRPDSELFPLGEFQAAAREVLSSPDASIILQLGSTHGYGPLRHYLLEEARRSGDAGPDDEILITSGCQQALDLLHRALAPAGTAVVIEDPVYHGMKNVFARGGNRLIGVPITENGLDIDALERTVTSEHPKLIVVTPNFQNPTGLSLSLAARREVAHIAAGAGATLVENDIYGPLRYVGEPSQTVKSLDEKGSTLLLRSFSKIAFPGLRVGWVIGPRHLIAKLAEEKQWCDLHTDQLAQAILLRFAESGRLQAHADRARAMGRERLHLMLAGCERELPEGSTYTRPEGGMSLWVRLPEPLDAAELLTDAQRQRVTYMPGRHFSVSNFDAGTLRLSFGGLPLTYVEEGMRRLGRVFREGVVRTRDRDLFAAPAMV